MALSHESVTALSRTCSSAATLSMNRVSPPEPPRGRRSRRWRFPRRDRPSTSTPPSFSSAAIAPAADIRRCSGFRISSPLGQGSRRCRLALRGPRRCLDACALPMGHSPDGRRKFPKRTAERFGRNRNLLAPTDARSSLGRKTKIAALGGNWRLIIICGSSVLSLPIHLQPPLGRGHCLGRLRLYPIASLGD